MILGNMIPSIARTIHKAICGISNLLSSVVLVTIVVIVGVATIAWVTGVFSGLFGGSEALMIYPNATLKPGADGWVLSIVVVNRGSVESIITSIDVEGARCQFNETSIAPGVSKSIVCVVPGSFTPNAQYNVKIYTRAGNIFLSRALAIQSS
ncbi:MAG TPA: hypothetical protein VNL13_08260 [Sulfolobales archaeon]|nr:hypothetical protein [Sulfolobales archaeon]